MDYIQKIEELLCQLALEAHPSRKVAAEVMRDLVIQIIKTARIEDFKKRQDTQVDIMSAMSRCLALQLFLITPDENGWRVATEVMTKTVMKTAAEYKKDFLQFKKEGVSF